MKLEYYLGKTPNFGDELNGWLWPQLLPHFFDDSEDELFLGIGSIISNQYDARPGKKIVFGSGYVSQYDRPPDLSKNWEIVCVRGPRTAQALNLPSELSICDAAILARTVFPFEPTSVHKVSFIPHFESLASGAWEEVCKLAGIRLIDPRGPVEIVMREIADSSLVISEAMHGAIIADAFRVPWIPVLPITAVHRDKWYDWAESLNLTLVRERLWPSTLLECRVALERRPFLTGALNAIAELKGDKIMSRALRYMSAQHLSKIAERKPFLSDEQNLTRAVSRLLDALHSTKSKYGRFRNQ